MQATVEQALGAVAVRAVSLWRNPLPIPIRDRGHRCFLVPDYAAAKAVRDVLALAQLHEKFTFKSGPTRQTVFDDDTTVILRVTDPDVGEQVDAIDWPDFGPAAMSLTVRRPKRKARQAVRILEDAGYWAEIDDRFMAGLGDKFVLVTSNAFQGWSLAFRRHSGMMGKPEAIYKLDDEEEVDA